MCDWQFDRYLFLFPTPTFPTLSNHSHFPSLSCGHGEDCKYIGEVTSPKKRDRSIAMSDSNNLLVFNTTVSSSFNAIVFSQGLPRRYGKLRLTLQFVFPFSRLLCAVMVMFLWFFLWGSWDVSKFKWWFPHRMAGAEWKSREDWTPQSYLTHGNGKKAFMVHSGWLWYYLRSTVPHLPYV